MPLSSSLPRFHCDQALRDFTDPANSRASSLVHQLPCSDVAMTATSAAPWPRLAAIKGGPPAPNQAHRKLPLSSLPLLIHLPLDIAHRRPPIASSLPVSRCRSSPEIDAIPGDATATRRFAVFDNAAAALLRRPPRHRWAVNPLPSPRQSLSLAVDDDERGPLDHVLIVWRRLEHTVSVSYTR